VSTIEEIEQAVSRLAPPDYERFRQWLSDYDNQKWDRQLNEDASAGKLDALANEALDDLRQGKCTDL
jgi:hypothetical protein